jgi:hypothetical protein
MIASAGGAAAAAAAARIRAMQEEEERLTEYSADDLSHGWEFKIVRANTSAFRKPEVLRQVCEEEARSGWQLVEKFDDSRLRFKRPASARNTPSASGIDPYRTTYGMSAGKMVVLILAVSIAITFLIIGGVIGIVKLAGVH